MKYARTALITGITGQDGSYLAEFLLSKGYDVHGIVRRSSLINTHRIDPIYEKIKLHYGDMTDSGSIIHIIQKVQPHEIYNLAAQSHVKVSFEIPDYTTQVDAVGTLNILESIRGLGLNTRFYQASSSELFGNSIDSIQNEKTRFYPRSPYAVAKLYAYWIIINYREAYDIFACNGILFNHESERRGKTFVSRKITIAASRIKEGMQEILYLGNLDASRDWGYAPEYCEGMWMMLQKEKPSDYVLATRTNYTVREFVSRAFGELNMELSWEGNGENEKGVEIKTGITRVAIDKSYYRPTEVNRLKGDYTKAQKELGWVPKTSFEELVKIMVLSDWRKIKNNGI